MRRELYSQTFDEVIRQSTICGVERGLLMLRVRDEFRMSLYTYMVGWYDVIQLTVYFYFRLCLSQALLMGLRMQLV